MSDMSPEEKLKLAQLLEPDRGWNSKSPGLEWYGHNDPESVGRMIAYLRKSQLALTISDHEGEVFASLFCVQSCNQMAECSGATAADALAKLCLEIADE